MIWGQEADIVEYCMAKVLLLCEDDEILRDMYQTLFKNHGYEVLTAVDGEDGLKKSLEDHPDLILLDVRMPKMDGMTVLKHLRQDKWGASVPVIMLSNLDANDEILKGIAEDHATNYLIKSNIDREEILKRIKVILENQEQNIQTD